MRFPSLLLPALLFVVTIVVTPPTISAIPQPATEESVTDGMAYQVCVAAAPQAGESAESLYAQYQSGRIAIEDLGALAHGHRYSLTRAQDYVIIVDVTGV